MATTDIIVGLDSEIARLQQATDVLARTEQISARRVGRPKAAGANGRHGCADTRVTSRSMSPEAKAGIVAAQKKRWAKQRGSAARGANTSANEEAGKAVSKRAS